MGSVDLNKSRLIVGLVLIAVAVGMMLFTEGSYSTAGAVAIGILGLVIIAVSRRGSSG